MDVPPLSDMAIIAKQYNWKRFWCPRTGNVNLSDGGYLFDPDSEYGRLYNPEVVPFESISETPCLALLGEPGMGKTYALHSEFEATGAKASGSVDKLFRLDLRSHGSEDRLIRNLFESPDFIAWEAGSHRLYLFLDSLDECLLRIDTLSGLLIGELQKYPIERLFLRIACRTAEWPLTLENGLARLWGEGSVKVYELAPLRRIDVTEAAKARGLQPENFLDEVDNKEVVPLAIKPITLEFFLNTYARNHSFPSSQTELYFQGCRLLCEEPSMERREARLTSSISSDQKLAIAARIAAVTVLSNRYAIWTGIDLGDVPGEDATVMELCGGTEEIDGSAFEVTEALTREVLSTGLFSSRGPTRMGWAHQTYSEFLAAYYVMQNGMALPQIKSLLVHSGDLEGKLAPQLHETAAWLSCMRPDLFREIMQTDPDVLLRSDVAKADIKDREALVESLLKQLEEEKLTDSDFDRKLYRKLAHPRMSEQLRPYISDNRKSIFVRRAAIDIAEACEVKVLQDDLVGIALNLSESPHIRKEAAYAISRIGDDAAKARLRSLATGEAGDDSEDELKGCALRALWPTLISAEDLFAQLIPPKRENFFGSYWGFISFDLVQHLKPSDLPVALKWVEKQAPRHTLPFAFQRLVDAIMLRAWEHLEVPEVSEAFAKAILSRLRHHEGIVEGDSAPGFHEEVRNDDKRRRQLLLTLVPMLSDPDLLIFSLSPPIMVNDIPWIIEHIQTEGSKEIQSIWAKLIQRVFHDQEQASYVDAVLIACQSLPILAEEFKWLIQPIKLNSPEAKKMEATYLERQKWLERGKKRSLLQPPPGERIAKLLAEFEAGDLSAWWRLNREMTLEPDSTYYGDELEPALMSLPGWKAADGLTRGRIIKAGKRYVLEQDPATQKWLGTNILHRPALAGYRALRLLMQVAPDFISAISKEVWKKWAPIILSYPTPSGTGDKEACHSLVKIAYMHVPDEIINTLLLLIDKENKDHGHIFIIGGMEHCWDEHLSRALLSKAKDITLKPESMRNLLGDLLEHNFQEARVFAESLVTLPIPISGKAQSRVIAAATALMINTNDAGWSVIWPAIQQDPDFGRELVSEVSYRSGGEKSIAARLTEEQLSELYIWLTRQFPHKEDPKYDGAHTVGARESVATWRDNILRNLQQRGTVKACEAIKHIIRELPELHWLKWVLLNAQSHTRRQTWMPPKPQDIIRLASNEQMRLVQNGDQLMEVIIDSLKRLEVKLHGETPAAIFLWNEKSKRIYKPKSENELSDYIKLHLEGDLKQKGIIFNREVEIHRGAGAPKGESTDIHVDAVIRGHQREAYDSVTVIIEVKGCWNPDLKDAMKTQLVGRYLKDSSCQHGIYLIGWFNCDKWDNKDYRKKKAPSLSVEEAQKQFDVQAVELSLNDIKIGAFVLDTALH